MKNTSGDAADAFKISDDVDFYAGKSYTQFVTERKTQKQYNGYIFGTDGTATDKRMHNGYRNSDTIVGLDQYRNSVIIDRNSFGYTGSKSTEPRRSWTFSTDVP